ncbi:MAG: hypothetical protein HZA81_03515 [Candidatus Taylorbacteria bacterium]|nr:hypothetical protein [Candidatus Taylorbacteria bacterium]
MSNTAKYTIGGLVLAALVLGYLIYVEKNPGSSLGRSSSPSADKGQTVGTDVEAILNTPAVDDLEERKRQHAERVLEAAVKTDTINISTCVANPTVAMVAFGQKITFVNDDSVEHMIGFNIEDRYSVPAKSKKEIVADFEKGKGIYGYGCDASQRAIGMIVVTE